MSERGVPVSDAPVADAAIRLGMDVHGFGPAPVAPQGLGSIRAITGVLSVRNLPQPA